MTPLPRGMHATTAPGSATRAASVRKNNDGSVVRRIRALSRLAKVVSLVTTLPSSAGAHLGHGRGVLEIAMTALSLPSVGGLDPTKSIPDNLERVHARIREVALSAGRRPDAATLIAVSKTHAAAIIEQALATGHRQFGENRIQEAGDKWPGLKAAVPDVELHLVGHLQTNKAKEAVALFDVIQTLDRIKLARSLATEMDRQDRRFECFVQVNTGEEPQKSGVLPADTDDFVNGCRDQFDLDVTGLMCIPPVDEEPSLHFALLRMIAERNGLTKLSMGMSADFEIAVAFGATHVRVGTAIFGARNTNQP